MIKNKWLWLALALLTLSVLFLLVAEPDYQVDKKPTPPALPPVTITQIEQQDNHGQLNFYAEIKPRWSITLKAHVRGQIIKLTSLAGMQIQQDQELLVIEDSAYQSQYAEAGQYLAEAKLNLLEEEVRFSSRNKKQSAMLEPRLEVARKRLATANSRLKEAQTNLSYTKLQAPFNGYVSRRSASLGQTVEVGDPLLELINTDTLDLEINLSQLQWSLLPSDWQQQQASLVNANQEIIGYAKIKRGGGFVDPNTRQYKIYLEIVPSNSNVQLVPGEFIQVQLPTKNISNSLRLPETALSRNGFIWYLDQQDRLQKVAAKALFHDQHSVVIKAPEQLNQTTWRIATTPLASFLPGMQIQPITAGGN